MTAGVFLLQKFQPPDAAPCGDGLGVGDITEYLELRPNPF